jgi:hypothetical protein
VREVPRSKPIMALLVFALVAGCMTSDAQDAREIVRRECGTPPQQPGLVVAFDAGSVTMSRADYLTLRAYLDAIDAYAGCVAP